MSDLIGQTLGRYLLEDLLGRGGMAEVYRAYQPGLDRYVAVKVLHPHLSREAGFVERFEKVAAAVARLRHPNIVQVIDFDRWDENYYMVMEYIDGPTLKTRLDGQLQPYALEEVARILNALASGVDYAHQRGVVHRDLKPSNIMFTGEGQVVLTDFGIARLLGSATLTETGSVLGTPAYMSPEQAQGERGDERADIYSLGVILYELTTGKLPFEADSTMGLVLKQISEPPPWPRDVNPDLPEAVESVVLQALAKNPDERYQSAGELSAAFTQAAGLTVEQVLGVPLEKALEEALGPLPACPYRGLFAFREEDAPFFFGRELFVERMVEAVEQQSLVGVIGPSGSGKSSVVFAGLMPHLRQAAGLRGGQGRAWAIAVCRPGSAPFNTLTTALLPLRESQLSDTARLVGTQNLALELNQGILSLSQVCVQILDNRPQSGRLLLVIDQFEELFTLCQDQQERRRFVDLLLQGLAEQPDLTLLFTLRADFLGQALSHRPFADSLQDADLILGPMNRRELAQVIENPARKLGVTFEAELIERILDDVGEEPGNLPLLEFSLTLLWEQQQVGQLTHAAYEAIGRVEGALSRYADQVYQGLEPDQQELAHRIFTQMVRPGEAAADTRRLAQRQELSPEAWQLVQQLADARLVVTGLDLASGHETVELVHEALIQGWGQLQEWMNTDRAFRTWQERLRAALQSWEASGQDEGALLRGGPLVEAEDWLAERQAELSEEEIAFIQDSIALREQRQAERERRRRITITALAAGLLVTLALSVFAFLQRQTAQTQAGILLSSQAEAELAAGYGERAVLLALQALENYPYTAQAEHALGQAVSYNRALQLFDGHTNAVTSVAWSPDGTRIASSSTDNTVQVWDPASGEQLLVIELPEGITGNVFDWGLSVKWSPNGANLLTVSGDRWKLGSQDFDLILWDASSGQQLNLVEIPNQAVPEGGEAATTGFTNYATAAAAAFAPHSDRLATLGGDNTALIWEAALQAPELKLIGHENDVNGVAWSPDETRLATVSEDGTARIWDAQTGEELGVLVGHDGAVNVVAWSPDGTQLATAGDDGKVLFWEAETGAVVGTLELQAGIVWSLAWSPDGERLATGTDDAIIRLWKVQQGESVSTELLAILGGHQGFISSLAWSPVDGRLASADANSIARVWNAAASTAAQPLPFMTVADLSWSSDGHYLALPAGDAGYTGTGEPGALAVWDVSTAQLVTPKLDKEFNYSWFEADYSPDDQVILVKGLSSWPEGISDIETIYALDAQTGQVVQSFAVTDGSWIRAAAWSPDGKQVGGGTSEGILYIWDFATGEILHTLAGHHGEPPMTPMIITVEWSPDGKKIATASADGTARIWDAATGETLHVLAHDAPTSVWSARWSPDGTRLLTTSGEDDYGAQDIAIRIWDAETGDEILVIPGHTSAVTLGSWAPNGKRIVSTSSDSTTRIWDAQTGDELLNLSTPAVYAQYVRWSPDGRYVAVGLEASQAEIWRVWQTTEELVAYAKECCVFRELTPEEREQFGLPPVP